MNQESHINSEHTASCILGAGYSFVAGLPLAKDLITAEVAIVSDGALKRFKAVWSHFQKWLDENPNGYPEEHLSYLYEETPSWQAPPFSYAVELIASVLATPRGADRKSKSARYSIRINQPTKCDIHVHFWRSISRKFENISAITTNYDLLIERALRHLPMKRGFGPGCYYGGIEKPQILKGNPSPFSVRNPMSEIKLHGEIPIYKLHGSLNWSYNDGKLDLYQDMRPAFRHGGDAAIIPPVQYKNIPGWLSSVWEGAKNSLFSSSTWIICGYSLPQYDKGIRELLSEAAKGSLTKIIIIDPNSRQLTSRYQKILPETEIICLSGLPEAIGELEQI